MNRRAQIKLFESLAVLVVFFFLLVFGISFYFVLQKASINRQIAEQGELSLVQLVQKVETLPELSCSEVGVQVDNCVDALRLNMLKSLLDSNPLVVQKYFDIFGFSRISVEKVFPGNQTVFVLMDYARTNASFDVVQVPLTLYNPLEKSFDFGVLEVRRYSS